METVAERVERKMHAALARWSPKMVAFVACILGLNGEERWMVDPQIYAPIHVTSDGFLIADCGDHMGAFLGAYDALKGNWDVLIDGCDLLVDEEAYATAQWNRVVVNRYGYKKEEKNVQG